MAVEDAPAPHGEGHAGKPGNGMTDILKGHVGPVPVWALAILGVVGAVYFLNRSSAGAGTPTSTGGVDATTGNILPGGGFSAVPSGGGAYDTGGQTSTGPGGTVPTNESWLRGAVDFLRGQGIDVGDAQTAISKYLAGGTLTPAEVALRNKVIAQFGLPPTLPETRTDDGSGTTTPVPPEAPTTPETPTDQPTTGQPATPKNPDDGMTRTNSTLNGVVNYGWLINTKTDYTLASIARSYGISTTALRALNPSLAKNGDTDVILRGADVKIRNNAVINPVVQGTSPALAASGKAKLDPYGAPKAVSASAYKAQPAVKSGK